MTRPRNIVPKLKLVVRSNRYYAQWWENYGWHRKSLKTDDRTLAESRFGELVKAVGPVVTSRQPRAATAAVIPPQGDHHTRTEAQIILTSKKITLQCGIYFLIRQERVVYVGQSTNIISRLGQHIGLNKEFDRWNFLPCDPQELNWLERHYIDAFRPALNRDRVTLRRTGPIMAPVIGPGK